MDNRKRNIHSSGPLGMLLKTGQIKKVSESDASTDEVQVLDAKVDTKPAVGASYFKTDSGIEFAEQELMYVDPNECEPWQYANRQDDELGEIDNLIQSIKDNKQLQPALIRVHPKPHGSIKYEVIFGRRRHLACQKLGVPFLAILKNITNMQDAIATQDAENKYRSDVSDYSNAVLYKRLLNEGVFKTQKELYEKLKISEASLREILVFTKIPADIISKIPDVHTLSKNFALKIYALSKQSNRHLDALLVLADKIGTIITSPTRLDQILQRRLNDKIESSAQKSSKEFHSQKGEKLFTFKYDQRGTPSFVINKKIASLLDFDKLSAALINAIEECKQ
jgi:ParB family transcriptional regulator, chromosome partitioning protein